MVRGYFHFSLTEFIMEEIEISFALKKRIEQNSKLNNSLEKSDSLNAFAKLSPLDYFLNVDLFRL